MTGPPRRVGLSLGLIDNPHDGLGEFCTQLVTRVARKAPEWRERYGVHFDVHLQPAWRGRFGDGVGYIDAYESQRRQHEPQQPHALWHTLHQLSRLLPPAGTARRLLTIHDLNYLQGRSWVSRWRYGRNMKALLARTDAVVSISDYTRQVVLRHTPWQQAISVIHNGVTDLSAQPQQPLPGFEAPRRRPFLLHLSRMAPSKNPQAILGLARVWPEMDFLMCGPVSADSQALQRAHPAPNVHFRLGVSDAQKAWAYGHCAGFVFPSFSEGFGLPPIEAMYFGKPVFLSRLTSLPEVGGDAAHYFDSFESLAMRQVVEQGLQTAPARAAALRRHAQQFSWDRAAAAYLTLYAQMLGLPTSAAQALGLPTSEAQAPGPPSSAG